MSDRIEVVVEKSARAESGEVKASLQDESSALTEGEAAFLDFVADSVIDAWLRSQPANDNRER